jgi:hypothetical protein
VCDTAPKQLNLGEPAAVAFDSQLSVGTSTVLYSTIRVDLE